MITLTIAGVDRTDKVRFGTLRIGDQINNSNDVASFDIHVYGDQTYRPELGEEVLVESDGTLIYGGVIIETEQSVEGYAVIVYTCTCKDFSQFMDRRMVTERYEDMTLREIVQDLNDRYTDDFGFTAPDAFVGGENVNVKTISFSEMPMSECLSKLAKLAGYYWYVDYDKVIHFFKKNEEPAPFNLTDTSDNFIYDSLSLREDISQIRNKVKVRGGEARAEELTEEYAGNGEQTTFPLGHKFADAPTVEVDGVEVTVGIDFLNQDADYDVMWNYQQKYLRFTAGHIPPAPGSGTTNITVTGVPLAPIVVQRQNTASITEFGEYEFVAYNDQIKSRDEALQYAQAQLQAYTDAIRNGSFDTYTPGLRSGQTITINSALRGISEQFLIQSVQFRQISPEGDDDGNFKNVWHVEVATIKLVNLIDVLQDLLTGERIAVGEDETLLNFFTFEDGFSVEDEAPVITSHATEEYYWEGELTDDETSPGYWDKATWG